MTSNTSPEKPEWFALIEKDAPSAQVRRIDKKIPIATGFLAITIMALGTFFSSASMTIDSTSSTYSAGKSVSTPTSNQVVGTPRNVAVDNPQSINRIADPTLNGGGNYDDDDDEYEEDDDDDEDRD